MATISIAALALVALVALLTLAVAAGREARAKAAYPPTGKFLDVDGRRVHYVEAGTGPPLVLIHGAGGSVQDFTFNLIDRLSKDFRVVAFDRPGLGYSDRLSPRLANPFQMDAESPQEQAAHLAKAADMLGIKDPIVAGHSFGGAVAIAWALDHNPVALVLFAGVANPWPGELLPLYRAHNTAVTGAILPPIISAWTPDARVRSGIVSVFDPQDMPEGYADHIGVDMSVRRRMFRANIRQINALRPNIVTMSDRYDNLTLPIEILHGTADQSVPLDIHSGPFADRVPSANLLVLDGIGHMPHHADPDAAIATIHRAAKRAGLR